VLDAAGRRGSKLVVTAVLIVALLVPASSAAAVGDPTGFPPEIDPYQPYDPQTTCDPAPQPGVVDFANLLLQGYPGTGSSGISRGCGIGGRSEHKEGRAFDWAASVSNPQQRAAVEQALSILLATDEHGNKHAWFRRFGLMYIIWNGQIFSSRYPDAGWRPYACNPAASFDNCHTRHVHFSFSRAGAHRQTSWWTVGTKLRQQQAAQPNTPDGTVPFERIAGSQQIETAIAISKRAFPTKDSAEHVFVAGADAPHDAMVAAVMAGAFNGAVLLTARTDEVEPQVDAEINRLLGTAPRGRVTFVGGSDTLPDTLLDGYRDRYSTRRLSGLDHFGTAALAAGEVESRSQMKTAVVIGTSGVLDALPMVAVAAANDWPVVFTRSSELPDATRTFLVDRGIETVHIAGPDTAVSQDVAREIQALGAHTVQRHQADDRYEAAVVVAERFFALPAAYAVASGDSWSDAVVGAAYAGERRHAPILLTDGETLAGPVVDYIERSKSPESAGLVIGGKGVVKPSVAEQLRRSLH
jgi:hypothetical protein